jgi:hypothetical protein
VSNTLTLYGGSGTFFTYQVINGATGVNVMGDSGSGYAPGIYAPAVRYNASLYQDGDRPAYARSGNAVDTFTLDIVGSSVANALQIVEELQALLDEARDIALNPRRRQFAYMALTTTGSSFANYAVIFGGVVQLPNTLLDASLDGAYTIENVVVSIEREGFWRGTAPQRGTTMPATDLITPSATLTTGNYNAPFGTFSVSPSLGNAPALAELVFSPISGGAANIGNIVVGARSWYRNYHLDLTYRVYSGGILEAEAGTLGTDASLQADATASPGGGGNTKVRISYATATNALRLTVAQPSSYQLNGVYRVFARLKLTGAATVSVYQAYTRNTTSTEVAGSAVSFSGTAWTMVDLGLLTAETAVDRNFLQKEGVTLDALRIYSSRSAGAGSLDIDSIVLVPADEYYLTWALASSTYASQATALVRASTLEPFGSGEFVALETGTGGDDKPTSHVAFPAGIGTGALYLPPQTQVDFVYIVGDSSWVNTWSPAGAGSGLRWRLRYVGRSYGPRGTG